MTLDLAFWAEDRRAAKAAAEEWAAAEPNVVGFRIVSVREAGYHRWTVRARLTFREAAQQTLGLSA